MLGNREGRRDAILFRPQLVERHGACVGRELIPNQGAFTLYCRLLLRPPKPNPTASIVLTLKFGKQSTQFVRVTNLPKIGGYTVRVSIFRQGVSFWFDRGNDREVDKFDWGTPILIGRPGLLTTVENPASRDG